MKSTVHEFVSASDSKKRKFALCDCRGSTQDCPGIAIFMRQHGGDSFLCNSLTYLIVTIKYFNVVSMIL